jgi:Zn-dependent peptidase ImmA (M78 family)
VERIAAGQGIRVQTSPLPDQLSGLLYREKGAQHAIIGVNSLHATVRQRFTIAHELGHFLLHKDEVHVDRGYSMRFRSIRSATAEDRAEIEANQFAAELLMPEAFIRKAWKTHAFALDDEYSLSEMARRFQVSPQALTYRLTNLGLIG